MALIRNKFIRTVLILAVFSGLIFLIHQFQGAQPLAAPNPDKTPPGAFSIANPPVKSDASGQRPQNFSGSPRSGTPRSEGPWGGGTSSSGADTKSAPWLLFYAAGFALVSAAAFSLIIRARFKVEKRHEKVVLIGLFSAALVVRLFLAGYITGHPFDLNFFKSWAGAAAGNLFGFYSSTRCDYPPLYIYILALVGKMASIPGLSSYNIVLLKLPSILADLATACLVFVLARKKQFSFTAAAALSAFYLFNPAVLINSSIWGQVDSCLALIVAASLILLAEGKVGLASACFALSIIMKPQGIIFLPVLFYELLRLKSLEQWFKAVAAALLTTLILVLPFSIHEGPLWIFKLYADTLSEYPYASVNAFNFLSLMGANYVSDGVKPFLFSYNTWGLIFIVLITGLTGFLHIKKNRPEFIPAAALLQIAGVFVFSAHMHERYLFPAAALALLAFINTADKRLLFLAAAFSLTIYVNTHVVLFATLNGARAVAYNPALVGISLINLFSFVYLIKTLLDIALNKREKNHINPVEVH